MILNLMELKKPGLILQRKEYKMDENVKDEYPEHQDTEHKDEYEVTDEDQADAKAHMERLRHEAKHGSGIGHKEHPKTGVIDQNDRLVITPVDSSYDVSHGRVWNPHGDEDVHHFVSDNPIHDESVAVEPVTAENNKK